MTPFTTKAQIEFQGPNDLRIFADFLPLIGALIISFSRLERRVTWAIESLLESTRDEAHEMESLVQSFSSRIKFLELTGRPVARQTATEEKFDAIVSAVSSANTFRNQAIHNAFTGISMQFDGETSIGLEIRKERYREKLERRPYAISTTAFEEATMANLRICTEIQIWVLTVRPNAENRVP